MTKPIKMKVHAPNIFTDRVQVQNTLETADLDTTWLAKSSKSQKRIRFQMVGKAEEKR